MKNSCLASLILLLCSQSAWGIFGPALARAPAEIAQHACREAHFTRSQEIINALPTRDSDVILRLLGDALQEWRSTPAESNLYAARAFCIHELVPAQLHPSSKSTIKTPTVLGFQNLGIAYFYYDPDGGWVLRDNPVDLDQLATTHLDSLWGRQAFQMMTELGWSKGEGECQEAPDEFHKLFNTVRSFLSSIRRQTFLTMFGGN